MYSTSHSQHHHQVLLLHTSRAHYLFQHNLRLTENLLKGKTLKKRHQALKEKVDPLSPLTLSVLDVAVTVLVTYCSKSSTRRTQRNLSPPTVVISWDRMGRRRCSGTWGRASTNTRMILITTSCTLPEDSDKSLSSACAHREQVRQVTADGYKVFLATSQNKRKHYVPDNSIATCIISRKTQVFPNKVFNNTVPFQC